MRLLVIPPSISDAVTGLIRAEAERAAAPGTALTVLSAPFGVACIETRFAAMVGAYATGQVAAENLAVQLPGPVVDGVSSAVKHAEPLLQRKPGRAVRGSFALPPDVPNRGLPEALARRLARP